MTEHMDCGGCAGMGSHRRWCWAVVGRAASHLGKLSEEAERLGDVVGSNCAGAANALYRASALLRAEAEMRKPRHEEMQ